MIRGFALLKMAKGTTREPPPLIKDICFKGIAIPSILSIPYSSSTYPFKTNYEGLRWKSTAKP
jgi:hypothetical protein